MALKRAKNPMPPDVRAALEKRKLMAAYEARPAYQRNDWIGWIARAKLPETRARRLDSMLRELKAGHGYMGMEWSPRRRAKE